MTKITAVDINHLFNKESLIYEVIELHDTT